MDNTGLVLELRVTGFRLAERQHQGVTYQTVTVRGLVPMADPCQPQVPALARLVGTSPGGIADIRILAAESETLEGIRLFPIPALALSETGDETVEVFCLNEALYATDAPFPGSLVDVGLTGRMRDHPVAQVRLYPFQYNPERQVLEVYRRLRVHVMFAPSIDTQASLSIPRPDTPYERILEDLLLNYVTLPPVPPPPRRVEQAETTAPSRSPALKILVDEDGLYQVTYGDLRDAGFSLDGVDPRHLYLRHGEDDVATTVVGEADGAFDPDDWLEFYGMATVSEFTTRNVYWLHVGDSPGMRMAERDGTPTGTGAAPTSFYNPLHLEEDHVYWSQLPPDGGDDYWFWERFPPAPHRQDFRFNARHRDDIPIDSQVRVALVGRTSTSQNPDHHSKILLNGELIDEAWWDGQILFTHEITIAQQSLRDGDNTLAVAMPGDTGAAVDSIYVNWFEIGYWDTYVARGDQLHFAAPETGRTLFTVSGFHDDEIHVYDITDPLQVARLTNGQIEAVGDEYRLQVEDDVSPGARYLALTGRQKRSPAGLLLDTPSNWRSPENGADYVIITHESFRDAIAPLANYRANQGLRVAAVEITDVYDEFSSGVFDPQAIRDFISYAYHHWVPPAPLYVLLVGDANHDYKDNLDTGNTNYVPTHLFESFTIGQTPTDNWFVSVSGADPLPDMFIGRLPVKTPFQADILVTKILTYEQTPPPGDWRQAALFVADNDRDDVFETISDELIAILPINYTPRRIYPTAYQHPYDPTPDIIAAINQGTSVVNYVGHGSVTSLGGWYGVSIFNAEDIVELDNRPAYPFLVLGNCYSGHFAHDRRESFAEEFVQHEDGGGIAAFSPTGLGYPSWHEAVVRALYETLFETYTYALGPATTAAKIAAFNQNGWDEPVKIFVLLGDPALALQVVQPRLNVNLTATPTYVRPGQLLTHALTYANEGNALAQNVVLIETYDIRTVYQAATPDPTGGNNVWRLGSQPACASGVVTVTVHVPETVPIGTTLVNRAVLKGKGLVPASATAHTLVVQPGLSLSKAAAVPQIRPGQLLTYTLTYANVGRVPAENVVLTETYDVHTTYHIASPPPTQNDNVWWLGRLPVAALGTITVTVRVSDSAPNGGRLVNTALLGGDGIGPEQATAQARVTWVKIHLPLIRKQQMTTDQEAGGGNSSNQVLPGLVRR